MAYGLIGHIRTQPGKRDELAAVLAGSGDSAMPGCLSYVVARDPELGELRGQVTIRIPVFRPTGDGRTLAIRFGVAELVASSSSSARRALFETVEVLPFSA